MLYTKYESSGPCSLIQEDLKNKRAQRALGRSPEEKVKGHSDLLMQPIRTILTAALIGDHAGITSVKFGQNPMNGFRGEDD